jgi:hypothetical protein
MVKAQWEADARDRLITFLREEYGYSYVATGQDVVSDPDTGKNYDYELSPEEGSLPIIALEIFRLLGELPDLGIQAEWSRITRLLTTELKARGVSGYLIRTPPFVGVRKFERRVFASQTADMLAAAIAANPDIQEFSEAGYVIRKLPGDSRVAFSSISGVWALRPYDNASQRLEELLPTKNRQLNIQGRSRALLILESGMFPHGEDEVRLYFSTQDMDRFPNIDQVFYEAYPGTLSLIFDKSVSACYRDGVLPDNSLSEDLFLRFVEHRLATGDPRAFETVTRVHAKYGSLDELSEYGKDALISCGESFAKAKTWEPVLWIIEHLKNDADPSFPNPMHDRAAGGEQNVTITSVRGRLCWLIQKVICGALIEQYPNMLDILESYALGPDFYIRSQACVPLIELVVRRRFKLPDGTDFMSTETARRVKDITFRMLRDAGTNQALLEDVSNLLIRLRDFTVDEMTEVIHRLEGAGGRMGLHNRCGLLLFAALFREKLFRDLEPFESASFKEMLHQEIRDGDEDYRTSLVWQMAGSGGDSKPYDYEMIEPYLRSFLAGPFCGPGLLHFRRICRTHIGTYRERLCPLIVRALRVVRDYMNTNPQSDSWDVGMHLEELFEFLSENCGENVVLDAVESILDRSRTNWVVTTAWLSNIVRRYSSDRSQALLALLEGRC